MDKSCDFRTKSLYWYSTITGGLDPPTHPSFDETIVDRYSAISALLFNRLLSFDSIVSPYIILNNEQTFKNNPYGNLILPKVPNLVHFINSKRLVFNKIGIESIVHDTKVIGDFINQLEDTMKSGKEPGNKGPIRQHREGIISCLRYIFQIVRDNVQNYERLKLKYDSTIDNYMKVMSENLTGISSLDDNSSIDSIPNSYLQHFVPSQKADLLHILYVDPEDDKTKPSPNNDQPPTDYDVNIVGITRSLGENLGSLRYEKGSYNIATSFFDQTEMNDEQISGTLMMQYAKTVSNIKDQLKATELSTINNVQQRLSEISSMFEKFTGTMVGQMGLFENINANVMESITNIEKTHETLKKTSKERLPYHHLILCYVLVGLSIFLLFVDYLKSGSGSYLF
uniref:t-SNARE coiled-coil homology domain-containing protein n=1 Tax=Theileria annulata TaxID=5874 RepID=A0A3B0MYJ6_THEAN